MNNVDKAAVPFDDNAPIVYPDKKSLEELSIKRKKKYSSMDLAKKPEGKPTGGTTLD